MVVCLQHYEGCARAAIRAAGRVRKPAAIESAHRAQRFLDAVTALSPLAADIEEPEELVEADAPVVSVARQLHVRTPEQRRAAMLDAMPQGKWISVHDAGRIAHIGRVQADRAMAELRDAGMVERRPHMSGYQYRRASDASIH